MSEYECKIQYVDEDGDDQEVDLTIESEDYEDVEAALKEHDPEATYVDHELVETEEGCEVTFWDCQGTTQVVHMTMPVGMESGSEEAHSYVYNCGYGPDAAYGYAELLYDSEKEEMEREEAEMEAKKIRVEWDDKDDVLSLFHRCVQALSKDFDFSLKKLKREVKENMVQGVMES